MGGQFLPLMSSEVETRPSTPLLRRYARALIRGASDVSAGQVIDPIRIVRAPAGTQQ